MLGGQLQAPGKAEAPAVGTALTGPVQPFIEAGHCRGEAIGRQGGLVAEQLGEPLVAEAVAAYPAIAAVMGAQKGKGVCAICSLLGKSLENPFGVPLAAHVLHQHQIALVGVPGGVGIHQGGGESMAIGLAHQ